MAGALIPVRWTSQLPDVCRIYTTLIVAAAAAAAASPRPGLGRTSHGGVTSPSCEQLGRPVKLVDAFHLPRSRDR